MPEWMAKAACAGMTDVMFPSDGVGVEQAKKICSDCPVISMCLEYALDNREEHGVWGGQSERARRRIRADRRSQQPASSHFRQFRSSEERRFERARADVQTFFGLTSEDEESPRELPEEPVIVQPHRTDIGRVLIDGSNVDAW